MGVKVRMKYFSAKAAKESANVTSASPMDTWTAERTFARNQLDFHQQKTCFLLMKMKLAFICAAIHSAVRVFTGEADEIAAKSYCGFCVKLFNYKTLYIASLLVLATKSSP
jgi:hypothetical protein